MICNKFIKYLAEPEGKNAFNPKLYHPVLSPEWTASQRRDNNDCCGFKFYCTDEQNCPAVRKVNGT